MPKLRVLPPVRSPITPAAIAAGALSLLASGVRARDEVRAALHQRYSARDLVLTDSGTSALVLALRAAAQLSPGAVALPAYGCYDVATAADGAGTSVLLYDLDPATLGPTPSSIEATLRRGARTVVIAHLYGVPVDVAQVRAAIARHGALLIEDAAQGAGGALDARPLGSLGSLGVLSFGRGKGVTGGRGGALLANDDLGMRAIAAVAQGVAAPPRSLAEPLKTAAQWLLGRPALYAIPAALPFLGLGETVYRAPSIVRGLPAFAAGMLRETLRLADTEAAARRAHAERLLTALRDRGKDDIVAPRAPRGAIAGQLRLPLLVHPSLADRFASAEARRLGIMPAYPRTLAALDGFRARVGNGDATHPGAAQLVARLFTAPTHGGLSPRDVARLAAWLAG